MTSNFLLINSEKTEVLIIGPNFFACNNLDPCLILYFTENSSSSVRNLGVLFDSNLSFKKHQNQNELYCQVYLHIYVIQFVFVTEVQQSDSDRTKNTNNTNKNKKEQVNKE